MYRLFWLEGLETSSQDNHFNRCTLCIYARVHNPYSQSKQTSLTTGSVRRLWSTGTTDTTLGTGASALGAQCLTTDDSLTVPPAGTSGTIGTSCTIGPPGGARLHNRSYWPIWYIRYNCPTGTCGPAGPTGTIDTDVPQGWGGEGGFSCDDDEDCTRCALIALLPNLRGPPIHSGLCRSRGQDNRNLRQQDPQDPTPRGPAGPNCGGTR
jgi:hypothetical protein